ncbi:MAG: PstA family ABC transporter permease [Bacilli bacterium]|jgi:phosphate transport system permease protein
MKYKKRKSIDFIANLTTYVSAFFSILLLSGIIIYILSNGVRNLSWNFITSDYKETLNIVNVESASKDYDNPHIKDTYFSERYGVGLKDDKTVDGNPCVRISYIAVNSPFLTLNSRNGTYTAQVGENLDVLMGVSAENTDVFASQKDGAKKFALALDRAVEVSYLHLIHSGGGIRGSLFTTLYVIGLTLVFSIPLGISAAIYLTLYAKEGKFKAIITNMIDATSGVPSIIFGLVGMIVFIPFVATFSGRNGYSILAGALTMTIVLLPIVVKTASEAIKVVPNDYLAASLALGASKTQTIFKVVLPNALPGLLTAVLLSIGRIIGESAALMFVLGTSIEDYPRIFNGSTTLSLHIWSLTQAEVPNFGAACSISIIILLVVFLMSISVKITWHFYTKKRGVS